MSFGESRPREKKEREGEKNKTKKQQKTERVRSHNFPPRVLSVRKLTGAEGQTLCIINKQRKLEEITLLHYHIVEYRGGFVQMDTANCVS